MLCYAPKVFNLKQILFFDFSQPHGKIAVYDSLNRTKRGNIGVHQKYLSFPEG